MGLDFGTLESLRLLCTEILSDQAHSLHHFEYQSGYQHIKESQKISISSTATCVVSLVATHKWPTDKPETKKLLKHLISKDTSADLPSKNPFTNAWILEAITALERGHSDPLDKNEQNMVEQKERDLQEEIKRGCGGVGIEPYPASAYLTQLVVRSLRNRGKAAPVHVEMVSKWAWAELAKQLALVQAQSKAQDPFAVAYLVILVTSLTPSSSITPEQASIRKVALHTFFDCQLKDGTWPQSRPLFHYPKFGNAYCYEYEMLTQLLQERELQDLLLEFLPKLKLSVESLASNNVYMLENGVRAWSSGHHPQLGQPESWATASVYHFVHSLDRLLAEAVRREVFRYVELPLPNPRKTKTAHKPFAVDVLDSTLTVGGQSRSLKDFLFHEFVEPILKEADGIDKGIPFSRTTPRSAIFYGPPGTSKTELSKQIANFLGWPYLAIDPSVLLRHGMDGIQAEANTIFRMLEQTDKIVVLFDEFDELVRERGSKAEQPFSRLLTTAMLPKLARLRKRGTLIFIIATNNIAEFDLAISRPGRFDRVLQVMPPTIEGKLNYKKWGPEKDIDIQAKFDALGVRVRSPIDKHLEDLTFDECNDFATELSKVSSSSAAKKVLKAKWNNCTLHQRVAKTHEGKEEKTTWADRCNIEGNFCR
jgi:hypothetical protein